MTPVTKKHIYFDYAASTPVDEEVQKAMAPYFSEHFGNPGALHWSGQQASAAVFKAREQVARGIDARANEIVFTGSATEANNLALRGVIKRIKNPSFAKASADKQELRSKKLRVITTSIEHESILETCRDLEKEGVEVVYVPASREGIVDVQKIKNVLNKDTILVSVMYANNEVGTIQPIQEIAKIIRNFRESRIKNNEAGIFDLYPLFHTDAVQAFQHLYCNVDELGVDLMTLSAHKIYGPKGIGALYVRDANILAPMVTGGGQEMGLRSGTENAPAIVGFGKAVALASEARERESKRAAELRGTLWQAIRRACSKAELNGSLTDGLPNNLNIYFPGTSSADMLIKLDLKGFAISPGAACSARATKPSHVLRAMGFSNARCNESIRISLGRGTQARDIDALALALAEC